MKRIYHPYWLWECYKNGMWRKESKDYELKVFDSIVEFTGNHILYGQSMIKAVNSWEHSCDNFLTNLSINRLAYIGHAGCCIEKGYPEYLVRKAWKVLTDEQRSLANKQALKSISVWKQKKEYQAILRIGKTNVTKEEYQMKLQLNLKGIC